MKNYRLKPEAVEFFKEKHATAIYCHETWEEIGVDVKALEEVKDSFLTFGHKDKNNKGSSLAGWGSDDGSHFHFTIHFPSTKMKEHDAFSNGRVIRELMNKIQNQIDYFYSNFNNNSDLSD